MKGNAIIACFLLIACTFTANSCKQEAPEGCCDEVLNPEKNCSCRVGVNHRELIDIVDDTSNYSFMLNNLDFLALYIGRIRSAYEMEDMELLARVVEDHDLEVIVELGGVLGPGWGSLTDVENGKQSALVEIKGVNNWKLAGGTIDYVIYDGPVRRLLYGNISENLKANDGLLVSGHFNTSRGPYTIEEAADEILYSMIEWRKAYPEIKFILGCNFPNWGWKGEQDYHKRQEDGMNWGDYYEVVQIVLDKVQSTETAFSGLIVDWPYNYAIGEKHTPTPGNDPSAIDWIARILDMEEYVKGNGIDFYLYTNTAEHESDSVYSQGTLDYVDLYLERGGEPDKWLFQSWYNVPTSFGPEDQVYSMAWLTNEAINKINED